MQRRVLLLVLHILGGPTEMEHVSHHLNAQIKAEAPKGRAQLGKSILCIKSREVKRYELLFICDICIMNVLYFLDLEYVAHL